MIVELRGVVDGSAGGGGDGGMQRSDGLFDGGLADGEYDGVGTEVLGGCGLVAAAHGAHKVLLGEIAEGAGGAGWRRESSGEGLAAFDRGL